MRIQTQDFYHGAALMQIVEHPSFKALNKASEKYGHYLINKDQHIFIKYSTAEESPWQFKLSPDDIVSLEKACRKKEPAWLCLVCGGVAICALNKAEMLVVFDFTSQTNWVKVTIPPRGQCRVAGSNGDLDYAIPSNAFPAKVFL
ncbi:hypothetical protein [Chromobacterium phragmitis]|uniref:Uncharacterized protein n=1 Tax=Chromobacterium phragmitis TaxID=2202141 RepID=A0A344UFG9_9NEIS|nr:hypothetical protein [Chromobacterium phragmitis]AXE34017.1 hypothetical protein DK843_06710 [Chromobacterium phragmitis]